MNFPRVDKAPLSGARIETHIIMRHGSKSKLRGLSPSDAWDEAAARSLAAGAAGFLVGGSVQAAGAIPDVYRVTLAPASGIVAAVLASFAIVVFYYHNRQRTGAIVASSVLLLTCLINLLWVKFTVLSLFYPDVVILFIGVCGFRMFHKKASGTRWLDDLDEESVRAMITDVESRVTWFDQFVVLWCLGVALLLIILFIR